MNVYQIRYFFYHCGLFFLCFFLCSCDQKKPISITKSTQKTNIIILTLDTTRPDHLGCYGYSQVKTPVLDKLTQEGFLFTNAVSPIPFTLPSHSSLFTGQYPIAHGVHENIGFKLTQESKTLAEELKQQGYQTAAFIAANVLDKDFGLAQGFEEYNQNILSGQGERKADSIVKDANSWLEKHSTKPFFLWLHFFDPHLPYNQPEPFKTEYMANPYDGEIAFMDFQIGKFIRFLKEKKLYENSLIVVVGDHGESLGEHGEPTHGYFAYDATLKIPLIIKPPLGTKAKKVTSQVRIIDIMPTVLEQLGTTIPKSVQGVSLTPILKGEKEQLELVSYGESNLPFYKYGFSPIKVYRTNQYKLIDTQKLELYDLQKDPKELNNLAPEKPKLAAELKDKLTAYISAYSSKTNATIKLDPLTLSKLEALGYAGGNLVRDIPVGETLPNSKENVVYHQELLQANKDITDDKFDQAQQRLTRVLLAHPDLSEAHELQANLYLELKKYPAAIQSLKKVLAIKPSSASVLQKLAMTYFSLKDAKNAEKTFKAAIEIAPNYELLRENLWKLYYHTKRLDLAIAEIKKFQAEHPASGFPFYWLGKTYEAQKKYKESEKALKEALKDPRFQYKAYNALGKLYQKQKKYAAAIESFEKILLVFPKEFSCLKNLGNIYYQTGKKEKAISCLQRAHQINPKDFRIFQSYVYILLEIKQSEKAYHEMKRVLKQKSFSHKNQLILIDYLIKLKKTKEALEYLKPILVAEPSLPEIYFHLGTIFAMHNMKDKAIQGYSKFLELYPKQDAPYQQAKAILKKLQAK